MSSRLLKSQTSHKQEMDLRQVGNQWVADLLLLVLLLVLSGCSTAPSTYTAKRPGMPAQVMVEGVPFFAQDELQCGPAALAMALNWSGSKVTPAELSSEVYTPGLKGSLQSSLIGSARRHGRVAYPISGIDSLFTEISAGHPVIVLVNLGLSWYPQWHYAVVIGYDQVAEEVTLHSGPTAGKTTNFRTFNNIWKRGDYWGLLVLPPDRLPEVAEEREWLNAVAGLEKTGQWQAAATAYSAALERWSNSFLAWMGLGNSKYSLFDFEASADAFSQAARIQPGNGVVYNNWAYALAEQGKLNEALATAQHAVDLGGPHRDAFLKTLAEIRGMR